MSRVLTRKELQKFVKQIPKGSYVWHDFEPNKKHSFHGFAIVIRDNNFHGSIHVSSEGQIHAFNQNSKKPEIAYWSKDTLFLTLKN